MSSAYHPYKEIIFLILKKRGGYIVGEKPHTWITRFNRIIKRKNPFINHFFGRVEERFTAVKQYHDYFFIWLKLKTRHQDSKALPDPQWSWVSADFPDCASEFPWTPWRPACTSSCGPCWLRLGPGLRGPGGTHPSPPPPSHPLKTKKKSQKWTCVLCASSQCR